MHRRTLLKTVALTGVASAMPIHLFSQSRAELRWAGARRRYLESLARSDGGYAWGGDCRRCGCWAGPGKCKRTPLPGCGSSGKFVPGRIIHRDSGTGNGSVHSDAPSRRISLIVRVPPIWSAPAERKRRRRFGFLWRFGVRWLYIALSFPWLSRPRKVKAPSSRRTPKPKWRRVTLAAAVHTVPVLSQLSR